MKEYPECKECAELTRLTSHAYYDDGYNKALEDVEKWFNKMLRNKRLWNCVLSGEIFQEEIKKEFNRLKKLKKKSSQDKKMKFYKYLKGVPLDDYRQWRRVEISFWEWLKQKLKKKEKSSQEESK